MTETIKKSQINREWFIIDAAHVVLGRLATQVAVLLAGKRKPIYSANIDNGDHVVVINSQKIIMTVNKMKTKKYYSHSGYPGGLKMRTAAQLHEKNPTTLIWKAVNGMLAKNKLRALRIKRLHIYADNNHLHSAQPLQKFKIAHHE